MKFSIARPLGYLMPVKSFITWNYPYAGPIEPQLTNMCSAILKYGISFIKRNAGLKRIVGKLKQGYGYVNSIYSLPVAYMIMGDNDSAMKFSEEILDRNVYERILGDQHFVKRLRKKLVSRHPHR
jgi:hypothetical protein